MMALGPDIAKRAQQEIDEVTEMERLPNFDDMDRMQFLNAIFLECLRYGTVTPLGMSVATSICHAT